MEIGLGTYLALASVLFGIGAIGFLTRRNMLLQLMSIEIMLNSVNLTLVAFNRWNPENHAGQVFAFFVIAVAAAEVAVGLAIHKRSPLSPWLALGVLPGIVGVWLTLG